LLSFWERPLQSYVVGSISLSLVSTQHQAEPDAKANAQCYSHRKIADHAADRRANGYTENKPDPVYFLLALLRGP